VQNKEMKITKRNEVIDFNKLNLEHLIEHISNTHHTYLKEIILSFKVHLKTILKVDRTDHPEVLQIGARIEELKSLLEQHLNMEELILFPYLKNTLRTTSKLTTPSENISCNLILKIKNEHVQISNKIKKIRILSDNYTPSINSSPTLKLCYAQLFDLEQDMHRHIFIEEQILFPKLLEHEKRMIHN
jgi:regulator of cell morphogenesis and NO signaling